MRVLILGSSGMVGSEVLKECIANPYIDEITVVNREKTEPSILGEKANEIIHQNYLDFSSIKNQITGYDICFYCIGVYTGSVPEDKFIEITYQFIQAFATTIESNETIFCLFSAQGANPESKVMFAKWKGKAEEIVKKLNFKDLFIFRPSYIYPSDKTKCHNSFLYKFMLLVYPLVKWHTNYSVTSNQLAKAMVKISVNNSGVVSEKKIYENRDIRNMELSVQSSVDDDEAKDYAA